MRCIALWALMLTILSAASTVPQRALVKVADASLRSKPAHSAELETQASYGTPLQVIESRGEWHFVEMPDGYRAWIPASSVTILSEKQFRKWQHSKRLIITAPLPTVAYADSLDLLPINVAFDVVIGSIFEGCVNPGAEYAEIITPDGRKGYLESSAVADFANWAKLPPSLETVMKTAASMNGVTYLWGGTTPKALDCSGFTKVCYCAAGLILPRNASEQAQAGFVLDPERPDLFMRGDLIFFGNGDGTKVTHVGIYEGPSGQYIHSSGRVFRSSFRKQSKIYLPRKVIGACRILGVDNPSRVVSFAAHPWYFDIPQ